MHRGVSESSLRGFSIDYDNLDDLDDDSPPLRPADWKPRPSFTRYPPRRLRTYAIVTFFILVVLYLTFRRGRLHPPPGLNPYLRYEAVDWSRFAYSQYVTTSAYLCNAVMVFEALHRLGSRAERILFYPEDWDTWIENGNDRDSQLLVLARDQYNVQLMPIKPESIRGMYDSSTLIPMTDHRTGELTIFLQETQPHGTGVLRSSMPSARRSTIESSTSTRM